MKAPVIIAHRGARGRQRENTIPGFRAGLAGGAEWVELDVHQTADGRVIVCHDFRLGGKAVAACTVEEAQRLARQTRHIKLPTLEDILAALPKTVGLNVEIKAPGIGEAVVSTLARQRAADRAVCSSFDFPTIRALADLTPRVRTGILSSSRLLDPAEEIRGTRADALFQEYTLVDAGYVREVQQAGFGFFVWTVNRETDLARMLELAVDGIITDFPEKLLRLRRARRVAG